jgi:hypothetical protein
MKDTIIITEPKDTDVLCGRGAAVTKHIGNQTYIRLVKFNKVLYATSSILGKGQLSRSIVIAIQEIGGRFLVEEKMSNQGQERFWVDIGDKKAIEKTSQALRENQPKVRKQLQESFLRYKKKYILPFTTNKHHLLTTKSAGVENISAKVAIVTSSINNNKWANNNNDDMDYHNDDNDDVLSMLKHEAIGYNANDDEMEKYVKELKILGLHSTKMIIQFCKDDDVNEWTWMKKFHKRAFKAWIEIKRKLKTETE